MKVLPTNKKGCAMGTICAPAYANIFMAEFEQNYVHPLIKDKSVLFLRYIDDIFMVWTKSEKQLTDFMSELNQKHPSIKFDCKQIEFLDTLVYIDQQNKLQTTLFRKSSDRQNFVNAKSEHPYSLKKSIPYSQALRIQRICKNPTVTLENLSNNLKKDTKKILSHSKFRRLTNSIENNYSINKKAMIINASL